MALLKSNTIIYGTANIQSVLTVGAVTPNNSISSTTGSLIVYGGAGITGNVYANAVYANGLFYASNNQPWVTGGGGGGTTNSFGTIVVSGQPQVIANIANAPLTLVAGSGINITTVGTSNTITFSSTGFSGGSIPNALTIANTTASTSNGTGALIVYGGAGITGNVYANSVYANGLFYASNNQPWVMGGGSSSVALGAIITTAQGWNLP